MVEQFNLHVIGRVYSPYKEKFAIPRQPGLVTAAQGKIHLLDQSNNAELVRGLEQFSHLWLLFAFHKTQDKGWKPLVRPPRLGGNKKLGVLATRSTFRPNPIGMSVVKLESIELRHQQVIIHISALDLLDNTPILDIKPYIPYADCIENAVAGYAQQAPKNDMNVIFSSAALTAVTKYSSTYPNLQNFIEQVLIQDPRPAYKHKHVEDKIYGMHLYDLNITWQITEINRIIVINIE